MIKIDEDILSPRSSPVACILNKEEMLICGGYSSAGGTAHMQCFGDAIIFNTRTLKAEKVIDSDGEFAFFSYDNQSYKTEKDTVVALVSIMHRDGRSLVRFEKGNQKF